MSLFLSFGTGLRASLIGFTLVYYVAGDEKAIIALYYNTNTIRRNAVHCPSTSYSGEPVSPVILDRRPRVLMATWPGFCSRRAQIQPAGSIISFPGVVPGKLQGSCFLDADVIFPSISGQRALQKIQGSHWQSPTEHEHTFTLTELGCIATQSAHDTRSVGSMLNDVYIITSSAVIVPVRPA